MNRYTFFQQKTAENAPLKTLCKGTHFRANKQTFLGKLNFELSILLEMLYFYIFKDLFRHKKISVYKDKHRKNMFFNHANIGPFNL